MKKRLLAILMCLCITLPPGTALAVEGDYTPFVSEDLDVEIGDVTYFDIFDGASPRLDSTGSNELFMRIALGAKGYTVPVPGGEDEPNKTRQDNTYEMWDAVAQALTSTSKLNVNPGGTLGTLGTRYDAIFNSIGEENNPDSIVYYYYDDNTHQGWRSSNDDRFDLNEAIERKWSGNRLNHAESIDSAQTDIVDNIRATAHYDSGDGHVENVTLEPLDLGTEYSGDVLYTLNTVTAEYNNTRERAQSLSWGVVFYDFGLAYLETGEAFNSGMTNIELGGMTLAEYLKRGYSVPGFTYNLDTDGDKKFSVGAMNGSTVPISHSSTYGVSVEKSISTSKTHTKEYTYGQSLSVSRETKVGSAVVGAESTWTAQIGAEFGEMWNNAWENGESTTNSISTESSTEVELPPHTQLMMQTSQSFSNFELKYDYPVVVTYKAICYAYYFVMEEGAKAINNHDVVLAKFGRNSANSNDYAIGNLENRYDNKDNSDYEMALGDGLEWNRILAGTYCTNDKMVVDSTRPFYNTHLRACNLGNRINALIKNRPYSVTGGTLTYEAQSINTEVFGLEALYPLAKVRPESAFDYDLKVGDALYVDNIELIGENSQNVPFYGFSSDYGRWSLVESSGTPHTSEAVAKLSTDSVTGYTTLEARGPGTVYLKYAVDPERYPEGKVNSNVTTAIKVNVTQTPFYGRVVAEAGPNPVVYRNSPLKLTSWSQLTATIFDADDNVVSAQPVWQVYGAANGVTITNNSLTATKPGSYQLVATYQGKQSAPVTIMVQESSALSALSVTGRGSELIALFDTDQLSYTAGVVKDVERIVITPTPADAGATIEVNGEDLADDYALDEGPNTFNIAVTSNTGAETTIYTVNVYRSDSNDLPSLEIDEFALEYVSASLTLTGAIAINYTIQVVPPEDLSLKDGDYEVGMMFWDSAPAAYTVSNSPNKTITNASEYYKAGAAADTHVFTYDDIVAKEMNDNIYSVAYVKHGNEYVYSRPLVYSVATYCRSALQYSNNAALHTMAVDMLNYGTAAQQYFGYRTNYPANSGLLPAQRELATSENVPLSFRSRYLSNDRGFGGNESVGGAAFKSASLTLDSRIAVNYTVDVTAPAGKTVSGVKLLYWDSYASGSEYTLDTADTVGAVYDMTLTGTNRYQGRVPNVNAKEMRKQLYTRVCVEYSDGSRGYSNILVYSVSDYAYTARNNASTATIAILTEAMMKYGDSAEAYFKGI